VVFFCFILSTIFVPLAILSAFFGWLILGSFKGGGSANWEEYLTIKDPKLARKYSKKKIPVCDVIEAYINEQIDFKKDVYEVFLHRNQLFQFSFTMHDVKFYFFTFLKQNFGHSVHADASEVAPVYDRGNDFYGWFLGETMVYTGAIFQSPEEKLEVGQRRKLDTVCRYVQMKQGDEHLDIGCGWGTLLIHAAKEYGAKSYGITLAKEQRDFALERAKERKVQDRVNVDVLDYRLLPRNKKYDKITCLEMAEHVGIKNFHAFLLQVKDLLKDDGIFYLQIAGLRRAWQYEDLVWGLFMGKYIFPGADASCPLGFVVNHLEQAGWEVHRVENCGVHYSVTIYKWYENWKKNKDQIIKKYKVWWYRLWLVFLGWSSIIAAQGSSTVFMITSTKNHKNDRNSVSEEEVASNPFNRAEHWIGKDPVATQQ